MKFHCESRDLAYALNKCASLTGWSTTFPGIRNVLIEARNNVLHLSSTDMATYVTYHVIPISIEEEGSALVDARSIAAFASAKEGKIEAYLTKAKRLMVKIGASKISLAQSSSVLPEKPKIPEDSIATIGGESLKSVLSVAFMAEKEDMISFTKGTMLVLGDDHIYAMATSRGRFGYSWYPTSVEGKFRFLLPKSSAEQLPYFLYDDDIVSIHKDENKIHFVTGRFELSCNELAGNFPYDRIASATQAEHLMDADVPAGELATALEMCIVMNSSTNKNNLKRVKFDFDKEYSLLNISTAAEHEIGQVDWPVAIKRYVGDETSFWLSSDYMFDIIKAIKKVADKNIFADISGNQTITIGKGHPLVDGGTQLVYFVSNEINAVFGVAPMIVEKEMSNGQN